MVLQPLSAQRTGEGDSAVRGELEGVGEEVEHDLLQPLLVGADRGGQILVELDVELERLVGGELAEGALHMLA